MFVVKSIVIQIYGQINWSIIVGLKLYNLDLMHYNYL